MVAAVLIDRYNSAKTPFNLLKSRKIETRNIIIRLLFNAQSNKKIFSFIIFI